MRTTNNIKFIFILSLIFTSQIGLSHPIDDYYESHKNDQGMEAKLIPPKLAAMMVDEDYPEAIDILKSLFTLKYLNFYGEAAEINSYTSSAIDRKGSFIKLLDTVEGTRKVKAFGIKKKNKVKKIMVVVETSVQFILIVAKGKLTNDQIDKLPALSREIQ